MPPLLMVTPVPGMIVIELPPGLAVFLIPRTVPWALLGEAGIVRLMFPPEGEPIYIALPFTLRVSAPLPTVEVCIWLTGITNALIVGRNAKNSTIPMIIIKNIIKNIIMIHLVAPPFFLGDPVSTYVDVSLTLSLGITFITSTKT